MLERKIIGNSQETLKKTKVNFNHSGSKSKRIFDYQGTATENRVITIEFKRNNIQRQPSEENYSNRSAVQKKGIKIKLSPQTRIKTKISSLQPTKRQLSDETKTNKNIISKSPSVERKTQVKWRQRLIKSKPSLHPQNSNKIVWDKHRTPYTVQEILIHFSQHLSKHEKQQIHSYKKIYYAGHKLPVDVKQEAKTRNWTNQQKQYLCLTNDHIGYQYQLLEEVGKGAYGQVLKAYDHKSKTLVALKIIRNKPKYSKQALNEYKILSHLKKDGLKSNNIIIVQDFFTFRKFTFMVFELLSINLFELIKRNKFIGLNQQFVRRIAIQLFTILDILKTRKIIHSDIKPQNIILKDPQRSGIKIIDFGSSCFTNETIFTYIQSRFYRAPEIFLGCNYDHRIDTWSVGCVLAELYLGVPLFPGENQLQQMKFYITAFGMPPKHVIMSGFRHAIFFKNEKQISAQMAAVVPLAQFNKSLKQRIKDEDFRIFIQNLLKWDPKQRWTPSLALQSDWIQKGLPTQFRNFDLLNHKHYSNSQIHHHKKLQQKNL